MLVLGLLPIVATNEYSIGLAEEDQLPSGTKILKNDTSDGKFPVIARPPLERPKDDTVFNRVGRLLSGLPPVTHKLSPDDLPARLCTKCHFPLPQLIDDRRVYTIAVVGTAGAGKTHYLSSALREAYRFQGLDQFSCDEFLPEEETAARYDEHYYRPLFDEGDVLQGTREEDDVRFRPLTFKVTFNNNPPCLLMFHDVSGETLARKHDRAFAASFVRRADAVIFLIDPTAIGRFRRPSDPRMPNQAILLAGCIDDLTPLQRQNVPYAITLSKSDLVSDATNRSYTFASYPAADATKWVAEMPVIEDEVRQVLSEQRDLLVTARQLGNVSWHAVAPIGISPEDSGISSRLIRPKRCLEPLLQVLLKIPGIAS